MGSMTTYLDTHSQAYRGLSDEDMGLVHALQVNGRASFREIADVLGISDQTAARRWARLRSAGRLRVLGLTDPLRLGDSIWVVRVRCTPDAAAYLGEAMARRTDTTWVNLSSGGTEISCSVRTRGPGPEESPLLQKLPRTPQVVDVSAHCSLHVFFGQDLSPINKRGPLTAAQVTALTSPDAPARAPDAAPPVTLDDSDRQLLDLLARDGRAAPGELATATGLSPSTVRRRITELRSAKRPVLRRRVPPGRPSAELPGRPVAGDRPVAPGRGRSGTRRTPRGRLRHGHDGHGEPLRQHRRPDRSALLPLPHRVGGHPPRPPPHSDRPHPTHPEGPRPLPSRAGLNPRWCAPRALRSPPTRRAGARQGERQRVAAYDTKSAHTPGPKPS